MPDLIQRVPQGLLNVLSLQGGRTPVALLDELRGTIETLQMYGLMQRTIETATNAALAEGGSVIITTGNVWRVLFCATVHVTKTATMTALRSAVTIGRGNVPSIVHYSEELGPFGATETGAANIAFVPPYPWLLPPNSLVNALLQILGTDATAVVSISAEFGILG
jgi:hypothetical protein